jgi:AcrR family transcriptional regulator
MRHRPQQKRSQQTVDRMLDAAATLFAEIGYEATTTNAVAQRAGMSIGSLYRYFPDKDAILQALSERHLAQVRALYDDVFTEDIVYLPLPVVIDRLIDPFVDLHLSCPAYKHMLLGSDVSADIAEAEEALDQEMVDRIASFLRSKAPQMEPPRARLVATICKAEGKALIALLTPDGDESYRQRVIAEGKRMLLAYLVSVFDDVCQEEVG